MIGFTLLVSANTYTEPKAVSTPDKEVKAEDEPPKKAAKTGTSVIDWLLSDEAFSLANPPPETGHGEIDLPSGSAGKTPPAELPSSDKQKGPGGLIIFPSSHLTPFQNLVAALTLSKPLSHRLGHRTIQTLLNPPFSLRTLSDLDEAGYEGRRKVMWEARTQHKEKTASQLGDLVDGIREICGNPEKEEDLSEMTGLKSQLSEATPEAAQEKLRGILTKIKGIGPGVVSVFLRRVQGDWEEVFPYADDRGLKAAVQFGLISEGEGAEKLSGTVGGDRGKMVRLLDVLVGLGLEKKIDEGLELAGMSTS